MKQLLIIIFEITFLFSCKKEEVIYDSDVSSAYELPLILSLDGKRCMYDVSSNTLKYTINEERLIDYSPYVVFQEYSEVKINNPKLINNSKNNLGNLELNTSYAIEIITKGEAKVFNLLFTSLPTVNIIVTDEILNEPHILGKMVINYPEIDKSSNTSFIGVEIRGKYSSGLRKKSYGIKPLGSKNIKDIVSKSFFEDMNPNVKWSLDGMYADASKLRNHI